MSLNASTPGMDDLRQKRQINEVADAEAPPNSSRLRVSPKQEVLDGAPSDHGEDHYQYSSHLESNFTSADEQDFDNGVTRDSSYGDNGDEAVEQSHTVAEQGRNGQHEASRAIPQSWEEASEADRILLNMKSRGISWHEIGKAWNEETGQDTAHIVLLNRYNRLKDNVQIFKDGDRERLLAAVEEVKAVFKREKWQLVKNAMTRAGAAEYSKCFIQKHYKKIVGVSQKANTTGSHNEKEIENPKGIASSHVTVGTAIVNLAPLETVSTSLGLQPIEIVNTRTELLLNKVKVSASTPSATLAIVQESKDTGAGEKEAQINCAAEASNIGGKETAKGQVLAKPGSLATNAILVDDTEPAPSPAAKVTALIDSNSRAVTKSIAPSSRVGADGPTTFSRPRPSLGTTSSRVGSATNRRPAKFTSLHKATDDDATRKLRNALNSTPAPTKIEPGKSPITPSPGGFGMLVKFKYTPRLAPSDIQQRMAIQKSGPAEKWPPQTQSHPQQVPLVITAQPQPLSTQEPADTQLFIPHTPITHDLPVEAASTKPLPYQKPPELQAPLPCESTQQQSPLQSIEVETQDKALTPNNVTDSFAADGGSLGRPKKPVTTNQLMYMLRHRILNDANRSKTWDVIAREYGVTATLAEISVALEQAGCPSIFNTPEPPTHAKFAASTPSTDPNTHLSSHAPVPSGQTPPVTEPSATPAISTASARAFEPPNSYETPNTRAKRGRPLGSKNKPQDQVQAEEFSISPSQTKTPVSGQKGHVKSGASKAAQSAAMKAVWKRRKEKGTNGHHGGSPKPSTVARHSLVGSPAATFAAEILAAAAANTNPTPTPAPPATTASTSSARPKPLDDEPVDLLTGESMFAQHYDDPPPAQLPLPPPAKKVVRRSIASQPI